MKKQKIFTTVVSLLCVVFISLSVTMAWFYMNSMVEIEYGSEIVCEAGTSLEVSMYQGLDINNEEVWSGYAGKQTKETVSAKLQDITGDGTNLYRVVSLKSNSNGTFTPDGLVNASPTDAQGYGDYIELRIRLRSTNPMDIYLNGLSSILPVSESTLDVNIFGKFSKDYIAGAMRVAILEKLPNGEEELKMVWAPNPNYQLTRDQEKGTYTFTKNGVYEQYQYYKLTDAETNTFKLYKVTPQDIVDKRFVIGSTNTNDKMINNSPLLASIIPGEDGFAVTELKVKIWFEGTDREADQALSGGQAKMNLKFSGMERKADPTQETIDKLNNIQANYIEEEIKDNKGNVTSVKKYYEFENMDDSMYFTTDGINWSQYYEINGVNNLPNIYSLVNNGKKNVNLYIRINETLSNKEAIRKMEFVYVPPEEGK